MRGSYTTIYYLKNHSLYLLPSYQMNGFLIVDLADLYPRQKAGGGAADIRVGMYSICMYV